MMNAMKKMYEENENFKAYVDKAMNHRWRDKSLEEILQMRTVKDVAEMYRTERNMDQVMSTYTPMGECCG